jgi:hypothetical protein
VPELFTLHGLLKRMRALRVQGRTLRLTALGREIAHDPHRACVALVNMLAQERRPELVCLEAFALVLLEKGTAVRDDWLFEIVASVLGEEGYRRQPDGAVPSSYDAHSIVAGLLAELGLLGLIERSGPWDGRQISLTEFGQATLRKMISDLAIAPRRSLWS